MSTTKDIKRITVQALAEMKERGEKITVLTAYDFSMARILDECGIEIILVGDSAANVVAGHKTTLPITLDQMIYHAAAVVRGVQRAMVAVDLPFGSYQSDEAEAVRSAVRVMKETGANAVKLEGGVEVAGSIKRIVNAGIPVMGHLGLMPQSINKYGTYGVRAKSEAEAEALLFNAQCLYEAGCFALVLEKIPSELAANVKEKLPIPLIGIGAGAADGQVLVVNDMLGITQDFKPRFLRRYADLHAVISSAVTRYISDVKNDKFPSEEEQY